MAVCGYKWECKLKAPLLSNHFFVNFCQFYYIVEIDQSQMTKSHVLNMSMKLTNHKHSTENRVQR